MIATQAADLALDCNAAPVREVDSPAGARWLQVLSHLDRCYGGLTAVVPELSAQLQQREGTTIDLLAFCAPDEDVRAAHASKSPTAVLPLGHLAWLTNAEARRTLAQSIKPCDGVHVHGLWDSSSMATAYVAHQQDKPYIVSAHGMLEPWALQQKALKKYVYGTLVERPVLQGAACLHALTTAEAADYRRYGCTNPIAVIPNAVEAPLSVHRELWQQQAPSAEGRRVVLFLGRLHVKKGLELLLDAWRGIAVESPDALLVLAGPGEGAYVDHLQQLTERYGLQHSVVFTGMLNQPTKWAALAQAHVFVLPSFSEGLSVATLEALSMGVPALVTDACHLPEIADSGCDWQISPNVDQLRAALQDALNCSPAEYEAMSRNARHLAQTRFSWRVVCAQMAELYQCVLAGTKPLLCKYLEATR